MTIFLSIFGQVLYWSAVYALFTGWISSKEFWGCTATSNFCWTVERVLEGSYGVWFGLNAFWTSVSVVMWIISKDDDGPRKRRKKRLASVKVKLRSFAPSPIVLPQPA